MVKLEEVEDETFANDQVGPEQNDSEWDTDSDISSVTSELSPLESETISDRIAALVDIIPPSQRRKLKSHLSKGYSWGSWGVTGGLKIGWTVCVSALLIVVPFSMAMMEDQAISMDEKQMEAARRENEIMSPGATSAAGGQSQQPL